MISTSDLGAACSATFGGLFRAHLIGVACHMAQADITSAYATMFSLLGLTRVYGCAGFDSIERDPAELVAFLANREAVWDRASWSAWGLTFAVIRPGGQTLPASVDNGYGFALTVAPLDLNGDRACFHWTDLSAAVARGDAPAGLDIIRVFTLRPIGVQAGLVPLRLPTGRYVDLTRDDLGAVLAEEKARIAQTGPRWLEGQLKAVASALTYGLLARADVNTLPVPAIALAYGPSGEPLSVTTTHPERPGPHAFLPAAAAVAGAARLVLALVERDVTAAGGTVSAVHADSLTFVIQP